MSSGSYTDNSRSDFERHLASRLVARCQEEGLNRGAFDVLIRVLSKAIADVYATSDIQIRSDIETHRGEPHG